MTHWSDMEIHIPEQGHKVDSKTDRQRTEMVEYLV